MIMKKYNRSSEKETARFLIKNAFEVSERDLFEKIKKIQEDHDWEHRHDGDREIDDLYDWLYGPDFIEEEDNDYYDDWLEKENSINEYNF